MNAPLDRLTAALADRYTLDREIGAGGMATVYLAHDSKHERDVAIKVLHPDLGAVLGPERFLTEIKTTARLQHPHILPLLDSGSADGLLYYVMPLVTGESLRARLERERQLPVEDALRIAREAATALEHAHRLGIIHRDIKPENILLQDGHALVADFGIALAVQSAGQRLTQTGLSLGTPQYMSPEQATGERTIDARSDVYALGAVLYEMLAGEPPFTGPTVQSIVARLMTEEPRGLVAQRKAVPDHIEAAVLRALEKLPADRFASAGEFAAALDAREAMASRTAHTTAASRTAARAPTARGTLAMAGVALVASAVAAWSLLQPTPRPNVIRYSLMADSVSAERLWLTDLNISPDGSLITRRAGPGGLLLVRRRDGLRFEAMPGTEDAMAVDFSPDGTQLLFYMGSRLLTMAVTGGPTAVLDDSVFIPDAISWGRDGWIYRGSGRGERFIVRCRPTDCRRAERVSTVDTAGGELGHLHPEVLPDGKTVVYQTEMRNGSRHITVQAIGDSAHIRLMEGVRARWVNTGHLLYTTNDGKLWVVPFDARARTLTGAARLVAENLPQTIIGPVDFAVSASGTLVYSVEDSGDQRELMWVTRDGQRTPYDSTWRGSFSSPVLSADGQRVAVSQRDGNQSALWVRTALGQPVRLNTDGNASEPAWSPDGRQVSYLGGGGRTNTGAVYRQPADGSGLPVLLMRNARPISEQVWRADGQGVIVRTTTPTEGNGDILITRSLQDTIGTPLLATDATEYSPAVSPDGRWLAYVSNRSGRYEVYVVPLNAPDASRTLVSSGGGFTPRWARDGSAIYFLDLTTRMVEARVTTEPGFTVLGSRVLFDAREYVQMSLSRRNFDVAPDGRFLMVRRADGSRAGAMVVVEHWTEELRRAEAQR